MMPKMLGLAVLTQRKLSCTLPEKGDISDGVSGRALWIQALRHRCMLLAQSRLQGGWVLTNLYPGKSDGEGSAIAKPFQNSVDFRSTTAQETINVYTTYPKQSLG